MQEWVLARGITRQITAPYTSVQNGIVERTNRTLQDRMRSMMLAAKAAAEFWVLAFMAAIYQYNRTPSTAIGGALPESKWSGKMADLSMLRVWGCVAWVKIHPAQRDDGKHLSARAARGMFLGYSTEHKTWLVWTPGRTGKQFVHSRDVKFDENRNYWDIVLSRQRTEVFGPEESDEVDWHEVTGEDRTTVTVDMDLGSHAAPQPAPESGVTAPQTPAQLHDQGSVGALEVVDQQDAASVGAPSEMLDDLMYDLPLSDLLASPLRNQEPPMLLDLMRDTPEPDTSREQAPSPTPAAAFLPAEEATFAEDVPAPSISERQLRAEARHIMRFGQACHVQGANKIFGSALSSVASSEMRTSADGFELEPTFRHEARQRKDWGKWKEAENEQLKALEEMQTWKVIELPKGKSTIGCRWVYKLKLDEEGNASRYKARLVAQGFSQVPGRDYTDTYAPTARLDTVRLVLAICVQHDLIVHQMDVVVAYLQGHLKDEIYMRLPPEYAERAGAVGDNLVLKLQRPLYGLKQAGKVWNDKLHSILMARGFRRCVADRCLYIRHSKGGKPIIILVYVDDLLICSPTTEIMTSEKAYLSSQLDIVDGGPVRHFLGIKITRDKETGAIHLSQKAYIEATLSRFGLDRSTGSKTPLPLKIPPRSKPGEDDLENPLFDADRTKGYAQRVGCIKWIASTTRPDMIFPANLLGRFQSAPEEEHEELATQSLRHFRKTSDHELVFYPDRRQLPVLIGFCDADYAGDTDTRRSTTGFVYYVYGNPVTWSSRLQPTVALSTTEAEYMALCEGMREGLWLKTILEELGLWTKGQSIPLRTDNEGCRALALNPDDHRRTKHIDILYHAVQEAVEDGRLEVDRVNTAENPADVCTKPFTGVKLHDARLRLHVLPPNVEPPSEP
ncbi:hypothetical protein CF319_g8949 [Tilletia indica]|nr:hypothetical protein CF319_g8949 [Tilletia indica]